MVNVSSDKIHYNHLFAPFACFQIIRNNWSKYNYRYIDHFTSHATCYFFLFRFYLFRSQGWETVGVGDLGFPPDPRWQQQPGLGHIEARNQKLHLDLPCGYADPRACYHLLLQAHQQGARLEI